MYSVYFIKQFVAYISLSFGSFEAAEPPYQNTYKLLKINGFEASAPCKGNVSANRMQSDESLLSRAMLRCSLTSPEAMVSQPRVK